MWLFKVCGTNLRENVISYQAFQLAVRPQVSDHLGSEISSYIIAFVFKSVFNKEYFAPSGSLEESRRNHEVRCLV